MFLFFFEGGVLHWCAVDDDDLRGRIFLVVDWRVWIVEIYPNFQDSATNMMDFFL